MISGSIITLIVAMAAGAIVVIGIIAATLVFGIRICKANKKEQANEERIYENQPSVPGSEPNVPGNQPNVPGEKPKVPREKPWNQPTKKERTRGVHYMKNKDPPAKLPANEKPDSTYEVPVDLEYENHGYSDGKYDCINMADISTDVNMYESVKVET